MKIHLIHGIHTSEGNDTIEKLVPFLKQETGLDVLYHRYGYALALTTNLLNPSRAKKIAKQMSDGDIAIGHSNGCAIIYRIMQEKNLSGICLINPALEKDITFPNSLLKWIHVHYNEDDGAVPLTEIPIFGKTFLMPPIFMDRNWGEMGKYGYQGKPDPRVWNFDNKRLTPDHSVQGHSEFFTPENLSFWGPFVGRRIRDEVDAYPYT